MKDDLAGLSTLLVVADKRSFTAAAAALRVTPSAVSQTVRALEEIVWALRPGSDSLQSLVEYIAHFANELFEDDATRCRLDLPSELPAQRLPIFLEKTWIKTQSF